MEILNNFKHVFEGISELIVQVYQIESAERRKQLLSGVGHIRGHIETLRGNMEKRQSALHLIEQESHRPNKKPKEEATVIPPRHINISSDEDEDETFNGDESPRNRRKRIRGKSLPDDTTNVLKRWLYDHWSYPYPTDEDKSILCKQCGLTPIQLNNWFTNARRRLLKPRTGGKYRGQFEPPSPKQIVSVMGEDNTEAEPNTDVRDHYTGSALQRAIIEEEREERGSARSELEALEKAAREAFESQSE
ncbi:hypothetical protein PROFUN_01232 [Planoprotostelium fungivorum]|uniref:Homeobox domain-containing protein n=1 Tax=Planoprotostelium fungivorum TaxID=1890364 RepID=A0A2P6NZM2_9EUKA|nr:hypothetical protein PROFUN_01232 [Planoprotostelium fungivorum]